MTKLQRWWWRNVHQYNDGTKKGRKEAGQRQAAIERRRISPSPQVARPRAIERRARSFARHFRRRYLRRSP